MAPPLPTFPASQLESHVQIGPDGRGRKTERGRPIELARDCALLGLVQYDCTEISRDGCVQCYPIQRWFRRYVQAKRRGGGGKKEKEKKFSSELTLGGHGVSCVVRAWW